MESAVVAQLVSGPVDVEAFDPLPQPSGAECVFIGRTRPEEHPEHGGLVRLAYEAYEPLARKVLEDLGDRAVDQFGCQAVRLAHSVGEVPPGKASVVIQVVTGHRAEAFAACRWLIDTLKREAPIGKREQWSDGHTWSTGMRVDPPIREVT